MLELTNVSLTKGKKQILSEINLSVGTGEVICIIGKNGVGKTTFLKSVLGMTQLTAGKSLFNDHLSHQENRATLDKGD